MEVLRLKGITQEFGGLRALDSVDLTVKSGQIFGIIGPNGAGKTTLFNIITGIYVPVEGTIRFRDQDMKGVPAHKVAGMGIGRTFQNIRLFNKLSVIDNVRVGSHAINRSNFFSDLFGLPLARREEKEVLQRAGELLNMVGLYEKRDEYADNLSYGEQRRLEIARALALKPTLLLLDEPAAGMNTSEKAELIDLIYHIRQEFDLTTLLVEHDMNLVMRICERIAVLDYGRKIAEGSPDQIKGDEAVISSYLGVQA
ncbi:MAG TPA: ABC transporter ATP-binding protein [Syntrophomonadaceae bacterium]|jgi:branched-chain amino acid transport system ATP-binding protein|nr:ABC transporter ATP-binding protein [Syntrophomonadaceae bacterium]HRX21905.1 ABC transporter ATP-binding protein [Syntrophomonadaceae bacterium]